MTQHASLSPERWSAFSLDQQILMIGNEMNRAAKLMRPESRSLLQQCYERVLRLVDLTVEVNSRPPCAGSSCAGEISSLSYTSAPNRIPVDTRLLSVVSSCSRRWRRSRSLSYSGRPLL
jgi:hypothetical protein